MACPDSSQRKAGGFPRWPMSMTLFNPDMGAKYRSRPMRPSCKTSILHNPRPKFRQDFFDNPWPIGFTFGNVDPSTLARRRNLGRRSLEPCIHSPVRENVIDWPKGVLRHGFLSGTHLAWKSLQLGPYAFVGPRLYPPIQWDSAFFPEVDEEMDIHFLGCLFGLFYRALELGPSFK